MRARKSRRSRDSSSIEEAGGVVEKTEDANAGSETCDDDDDDEDDAERAQLAAAAEESLRRVVEWNSTSARTVAREKRPRKYGRRRRFELTQANIDFFDEVVTNAR